MLNVPKIIWLTVCGIFFSRNQPNKQNLIILSGKLVLQTLIPSMPIPIVPLINHDEKEYKGCKSQGQEQGSS